jgi:hypothetical protein
VTNGFPQHFTGAVTALQTCGNSNTILRFSAGVVAQDLGCPHSIVGILAHISCIMNSSASCILTGLSHDRILASTVVSCITRHGLPRVVVRVAFFHHASLTSTNLTLTQVRCKAPPHTCPRASPVSLKSTSSIITRVIPRCVPPVDRGPTTSTYSLRQARASSVRTIAIFLIVARQFVCVSTNTSYASVCCSYFMRNCNCIHCFLYCSIARVPLAAQSPGPNVAF